jgi:hypothetical protein
VPHLKCVPASHFCAQLWYLGTLDAIL